MELLILFVLLVGGSFAYAIWPVKRTVTVVLNDAFEPPRQLPAVVQIDLPQAHPMAETLAGIEYDSRLMIDEPGKHDLKEAA